MEGPADLQELPRGYRAVHSEKGFVGEWRKQITLSPSTGPQGPNVASATDTQHLPGGKPTPTLSQDCARHTVSITNPLKSPYAPGRDVPPIRVSC